MTRFRQAREVTFAMIPPSRATYAGFTFDMGAGRQRVFNLLDHCR